MLTSWKEIADRLGVTVRTAQSYEKSRGLPVRRMGSRVGILESELLAWRQSNLTLARWWRRSTLMRGWALAASGFLLASALGFSWYYWTYLRVGQPVSASWQNSLLTAFDSQGRIVWRRQFSLQLMPDPRAFDDLAPRTVDLDNDGQAETVFCYHHVKREALGWQLDCVSSAGKERWRLGIIRKVSNASSDFSPPYVLRDFLLIPSPEKDKTFWTAGVFVHHLEYPSVLVVVDAHGRVRGEFWQAGHLNAIRALDLDGDGSVELLVAGVQHGVEQAVLHVLDPANVRGQALLDPTGAPEQLLGMAPGTERTSVFFPRSELNRKTSKFNFIQNLEVLGDRIQATVIEHVPMPLGYLVYTLNRNLEVKSLTASVSYGNAVTLAELKGMAFALESGAELEKLKREVRVVKRIK